MGTPSLIYRKAKTFDDEPFCVDDNVSTLFLSLITVFVTFALPVLIILDDDNSLIARRRHPLKMVLTIIVFFMVSLLPFNI